MAFDALTRRASSALRLARALALNPFRRPNEAPVWVLGHHKSGTTAVAGLLAEMTHTTATLDLVREVVRPSFDQLASGELSLDDFVARNRVELAADIVKVPQLTFFHDQLKERWPASPFVLVVRDPRRNIRSILDRLGAPGTDPDAARDQRHRNDAGWRLTLDSSWLGIHGSVLETLAQRWNRCADVFLQHPDEVRLVRYEDFVADKEGVITALAADVGLVVVAEGRVDRAFQPAGARRGVEPVEFFGSENLATIERICGERMAALGYDVSTSGDVSARTEPS